MKKTTNAKKTAKPAKKPAKTTAPVKSAAKSTAEIDTIAKSVVEQKPNVRPYLFAAIILFAICGLLIAKHLRNPKVEITSQPSTPTPADLVEGESFSNNIVEQLKNGKCAEIADQTSQGFQAVITEEDWLEQCATAGSVLEGKAKEFKVADSNTKDDITEFSYKIAASDDETYILTTQLVFRDGRWLLQGINSGVIE